MRRFTILTLMGLVLVLAVGMAALRGANDYWAGGLLLATPLLLGITLIGALCGKERSRAGRLGFSVLGGGYFALAFLGLSEGNLAKLPTSKLLRHVHERVAGPQTFTVLLTSGTAIPSGSSLRLTTTPQALAFTGAPTGATNVTGVFTEAVDTNAQTPSVWRSMFPGAINQVAFQGVGHCLFALLAGLVGAVAAKGFEKGRQVG